jgi:uncharacterized protein YukJ
LLFSCVQFNSSLLGSQNGKIPSQFFGFLPQHGLADNHFDKLNYRGKFFFEYNEVLERIELLNKYLKQNKNGFKNNF